MGFWMNVGIVLGGAAAAVLAIPTGGASVAAFGAAAAATGAATAAGMAGAAAAGAATGAAIGHMIDKKKEEEAYQRGKEEATAKATIRVQKMEKLVQSMYDSMQQANEHYQFTIALVAVGMAAAHAIGKDSSEEKSNIEEFVTGISGAKLPENVRDAINKYKQNPPSMHEAIAEVRKVKSVAPVHFEEVILLALDDEAGESPAGKKFLAEWNKEFA